MSTSDNWFLDDGFLPSFNENQIFDDDFSNNSACIFQGPIESELFYNNSENFDPVCLILLIIFKLFDDINIFH